MTSTGVATLTADANNTMMSQSRQTLLELLSEGTDVILEFKGVNGDVEEVPAHSIILKQWSQTLAEALGLGARQQQQRQRQPHYQDPHGWRQQRGLAVGHGVHLS